MVQWIRIHLPIQRIHPWFRKIPRPMEQLSGCHSYQSPCPRGPMLCNKSSHHNENSVHCNDTVASTHCNWRKTCINEDWAQPKIKINNIKKKKKEQEECGRAGKLERYIHFGNHLFISLFVSTEESSLRAGTISYLYLQLLHPA